ncbi:hypothetical protein Rsub_13201 [Raphidocelis subcapitata]|uniref:AB hydrolase-1 domain-containing protein n=1 Tax=Raphidocelis subcapitata TaxID=307507 RepID=A0A2V0PKX7_9CHLO|nr:hypothetical protein Rsub_13201 [Raphidocelis subcapitata]|eukprot:GBG00455.1 hypothetical protein Rsub_13201 [Raphidocelis subcapitata]
MIGARGLSLAGHLPQPRLVQPRRPRTSARVTCQAGAPALQYATAGAAVALDAAAPPAPLSCELVQGNLARFSSVRDRNIPTAVLVHGILGSRRNLQSFAHMIVEGFPSWQVLLVDLRCHGESAAAAGGPGAAGPHTVDAAARDVLELLRERRMFPQMLIGHSFGGKVVMSMARQFGVSSLPRPVQVWVLDTLPGEVRAGGGVDGTADHPANLIAALQSLPTPIASRAALIDALAARGFSLPVSRWMTTNLRPHEAGGGALTWSFDLDGIADLYRSYESTCLWDLLEAPPQGLRVDFVRATRSTFRWDVGGAEGRIAGLGHRVHALEAGHWVHTENPGGLFEILAPTFGVRDLHMQKSTVPFAR